jgi:hypothetical protein
MRVFISWSGPRSRRVAEALRDWLQDVIQALEPWMSTSDIEKGARWLSEISTQLEESQIGIICLTRDNMESPWLLFEAGALSKMQKDSYVCTFLLDIDTTEVREPLAQFQSTTVEKGDVFRLISTINNASGEGSLTDRQLERAFERAWPDLEELLTKIAQSDVQTQPDPDFPKMLEEILGYVRTFSREGADAKVASASEFRSEEIILLGKILDTNKHLNIIDVSESQIHFQDGTHGTIYKINRRALSDFLRRLRKSEREQKKVKSSKSSAKSDKSRI